MSDTMSLSNSEWKETEVGRIPTSWQSLPIGDFGDVTKLAGFEYTKHITYVDDGEIIALRALNVRNGNLDLKDIKRIYKDVSDGLIRSKLFKGDILLTYVGANIGQFALIPENDKFHLAPNICRIRCGEKCDPYFLYSYFRTDFFKNSLEGFSHGSSQPTMPMGSIRQIPIPIPPLPEQKAIAEALSSLDDKIDLLHRQNKTLEQMAETLFRQWFENFEFSNNCKQGGPFKNSELGLIPFNWRVGQIKDVVSILDSGSRPKGGVGQYSSGIPSIGAENVKGIGMYDYSKTKYIPKEYFKTMKNGILTNRDILVYKDGGTPGTFIPHFSLVGEGFPYETMTINEHVFRVITKESYQQNYLYLWLNTKLIISELGERGTGAAIPGINSTEFKETVLLIPETSVLKAFNEQVEPLIHKILKNACSIRTLGIMRDTLLPKLISGEVRIV